MFTVRIYYAQPVDFVPVATLKKKVKNLQGLLEGLDLEIVTPYLDEQTKVESHSDQFLPIPLDREQAQQIVERDYALLETCDILLVDLSREDRQTIGMIFEIAYALQKGKRTVIFTNGTSLGQRVWIIATADAICNTWNEVKKDILTFCLHVNQAKID